MSASLTVQHDEDAGCLPSKTKNNSKKQFPGSCAARRKTGLQVLDEVTRERSSVAGYFTLAEKGPGFRRIRAKMLQQGLLLLGCVAACTAVGGGLSLPAPSTQPSGARWVALRGPASRVGPNSCTMACGGAECVGVIRRSLTLRGGSDGSQGAGANQLALTPVTDCKELVSALMSNDNDVRAAAEKRYAALKTESPDATSIALIQEVSSGVEEGRTMAAVLARSALPEMWEHLSDPTKEGIKRQLLLCLDVETSSNIARKLAGVVGALAFSVRDGGWPDLIPAMVAMCNSDVIVKKETAYHVLAILPHQIGEDIKKHFSQLSGLYEHALTCPDSNVQVSGMRAITSYLGVCEGAKEMKALQAMLPAMLAVVGTALQTDEANARAILSLVPYII